MAAKTLTELADSFAMFDDWESRYRYLIDLGGRLTPMEDSLKTNESIVQGCTSRVWLVGSAENGRLRFTADSDAQIVKGLIYILDIAYQDKPLAEISQIDIKKAFEQLGLHQHLSPNRRNGFFAMVERIHSLAASFT